MVYIAFPLGKERRNGKFIKGFNTNPRPQGISLPVKQFSTFISLLPQIETTLHERGEVVSRPIYRYMPPDEKDPHKDEKTPSDSQMGKQNFEETSDED